MPATLAIWVIIMIPLFLSSDLFFMRLQQQKRHAEEISKKFFENYEIFR